MRIAKKQQRRDTWRSMGQAFTLTRKQDPKFLPYVILFCVLAAAVVYLLVLWITDSAISASRSRCSPCSSWRCWCSAAGRRAAMYSQAEGQPGAAGWLLQQQLKGDWRRHARDRRHRLARRRAPPDRPSRHRARR